MSCNLRKLGPGAERATGKRAEVLQSTFQTKGIAGAKTDCAMRIRDQESDDARKISEQGNPMDPPDLNNWGREPDGIEKVATEAQRILRNKRGNTAAVGNKIRAALLARGDDPREQKQNRRGSRAKRIIDLQGGDRRKREGLPGNDVDLDAGLRRIHHSRTGGDMISAKSRNIYGGLITRDLKESWRKLRVRSAKKGGRQVGNA